MSLKYLVKFVKIPFYKSENICVAILIISTSFLSGYVAVSAAIS